MEKLMDKLGDICEFIYGEGLPQEERIPGPFPVYGSNGKVGWHHQSIVKEQTIIVGRKGSIGEVHYSETPCWPIDTTYYVKPKEQIDLLWLYYLLKSLNLSKLDKSAAVPGLNRSDAYDQEITVPTYAQQRKIASILQKADRIRRLRRYAREMSETFLQSVFLQMFGDDNVGERVRIGSIAEVKTGGTPDREKQEYFSGDIPWVKTNEVYGNVIKSTEESITRKGLEESNCQIFPPETVLVAMYGQGLTRGRTAKLGISAATNQACAAILPSKHVLSDYLWTYLQISYNSLREMGRGGNQPNLNLSMVKDFLIPLPSVEKQREFQTMFDKNYIIQRKIQESERQAEHLFQSLLDKAFCKG
jgi:type I restriction enzyme, S subunit